jgi:hypothetical protein
MGFRAVQREVENRDVPDIVTRRRTKKRRKKPKQRMEEVKNGGINNEGT